ncbi:LacI family DNA-binding transcriptional regulator [Devosia sp.]|uniref:LacI family DNA-binding transcriptional regulator n=1 Tax=Devosia sp. TaxID=1871048 RepID=UPI0019F3AD47|nr:LacI family DNA-binding transcriptional regulator [Devosia sp.]MBE0579720.1 LacI family DNA-binding transcriptional regulator [Devosia sp.]
MAEVGRLAGVSQVTVSRALSAPEKVSPETLTRIQDAIARTGYVPNAVAGALASNKSNLIAALVPSVTNIVYASMLHAFSEIMWQHGYQIMLSETGFDPQREEKAIATHLSRRPDAILLTGVHHSPAARRMLHNAGIPVVEVWDVSDTPIDRCVGFSHIEAGSAVADFAADAGYAHAATITAGDERALRRRDAFTARFERRTGTKVEQVNYADSASLGVGRQALAALVERGLPPHAVVFCSSDQFAHGALIEAAVRGLSIPDEIAIIGFGDQEFAASTAPALTSVRIDRQVLGQTAAYALVDRFGTNPTGPKVYNVGFEIVRRQTA